MSTTTAKRGGKTKFLALTASLSMLVAGLVGVAVAAPASADEHVTPGPEPMVWICHADMAKGEKGGPLGGEGGPGGEYQIGWNVIKVSANAWQLENSAHSQHPLDKLLREATAPNEPDPGPEECGEVPPPPTFDATASAGGSGLFCTPAGATGNVSWSGAGSSTGQATQAAADAAAQAQADANAETDRLAKTAGLTPGACIPNEEPPTVVVTEEPPAPVAEPVALVESAVIEAPAAPVAAAPAPAVVNVPAAATVPAAVPAGGGSQAPGMPMWALALVVVGAIGAAAAGKQILGARN